MWLKSYHGFLVELVVYFYVKNLDIPSFVFPKYKRHGKQVRSIEFRSKIGHLNRLQTSRINQIMDWIAVEP